MLFAKAAVTIQHSLKRENGQGFVEYGLILAGIALVVAIAIFALGPVVSNFYSNNALNY